MNAVITGASKGIGKAIAEKLAREGFNIAICARNSDTLAQAVADIRAQNTQVEVFSISADMSKKEDVLAFAGKVKSFFPVIDILVNNAGVFVPGRLDEQEDGLLESMMAANVYSAYHLTRQLLPAMKAIRKGHIFNLCSTASYTSYPNGGAYSITKFALYGLTKVLREEMKPYGIRVTAVLPGATLTASWEGVDLPAERFMKAEDVAEAMYSAFALSKQSVVEEILIRPQLGDI